MKFDLFLSKIPKIQHEILLGEVSHAKMCPPERADLMKNLNFKTIIPREAAVMILLYPKENETYLALILRNSYNGVHSSQVAFPGGKTEKTDANFQETALRETHEEIGIQPNNINVIKKFTPIYIPPSNFMVYPFLGFANSEIFFTPDLTEVAGIIEFPISQLLNENIFVIKTMSTAYNENIDVPAFKINEHYVWGATAMILSELKDVFTSTN